jgi:hypothetical protein
METVQILRPIMQAESEDKRLLGILKVFSDRADECETDDYKMAYKHLCNSVRSSLKEKRVVGFAELIRDTPTMAILIYDIEADDNNYYNQKFDENNQPYLEL